MEIRLASLQQQTLSTNMVQSLSILQMTTQELVSYLEKLSNENPFIDIDLECGRKEEGGGLIITGYENNGRSGTKSNISDYAEQMVADEYEESFEEHIRMQLPELKGPYAAAVEILLQSFDHNGWITDSLDALERRFGISEKAFRKALAAIQETDPPGTGASGLSECLLLQLERKGNCTKLHTTIIQKYLPLVGKKQWKQMAEQTGETEEKIKKVVQDIWELNPRPAAGFSISSNVPYIVPDVFVDLEETGEGEQQVIVSVNHENLPSVSRNSYYTEMLKSSKDPEVTRYLKEKQVQVVWLEDALCYRESMLSKSAGIIAKRQKDFLFCHGNMVPFRMKEMAEELGVSSSTVSRAVKNKYLECRRGVFSMRSFFAAPATGNRSFSAEQVKELIGVFVRGEDSSHPLTDDEIRNRLYKIGCSLSRRTVAKYRSEYGIPPAGRRKKH